jgi:hypothetical protein
VLSVVQRFSRQGWKYGRLISNRLCAD